MAKGENTACTYDTLSVEEESQSMAISSGPKQRHLCCMRYADFTLSSWRGKVVKLLAGMKVLAPLLRKVVGDIAASLFVAAGGSFTSLLNTVDSNAHLEGEALIEHSEMTMISIETEAQFFCQSGYEGLDGVLDSILRQAARKAASEANKRSNVSRKSFRSLQKSTSPSFLEDAASRGSVAFIAEPRFQLAVKKGNVPSSFLLASSAWYQGISQKVAGYATSMKDFAVEALGKRFGRSLWWKSLSKAVNEIGWGAKSFLGIGVFFWLSSTALSWIASATGGLATLAIAGFCVILTISMMFNYIQFRREEMDRSQGNRSRQN